MKKILFAVTGASLLYGFSGLSVAADLAAGKAAYEKYTCASCHGDDAKTSISPAYPILAGQHADYLKHALTSYRRGHGGAPASANIRKNAIMGAMATPLTSEDIDNMSAWLASLPSPLAVRK